eukprot:419128-Prymnesium_polylepis.1
MAGARRAQARSRGHEVPCISLIWHVPTLIWHVSTLVRHVPTLIRHVSALIWHAESLYGISCAIDGTEVAVSYDVAQFASGGGFSNFAPTPSYQQSAVKGYLASGIALPPSSYFNSSGRAYPDVAAMGNNYLIQIEGEVRVPLPPTAHNPFRPSPSSSHRTWPCAQIPPVGGTSRAAPHVTPYDPTRPHVTP